MNGGTNPITNIVTSVMQWLEHPFTQEGSAFNWWLFVGLLIVIGWSWNIILMHLTDDL
jgi:hypothetical protein